MFAAPPPPRSAAGATPSGEQFQCLWRLRPGEPAALAVIADAVAQALELAHDSIPSATTSMLQPPGRAMTPWQVRVVVVDSGHKRSVDLDRVEAAAGAPTRSRSTDRSWPELTTTTRLADRQGGHRPRRWAGHRRRRRGDRPVSHLERLRQPRLRSRPGLPLRPAAAARGTDGAVRRRRGTGCPADRPRRLGRRFGGLPRPWRRRGGGGATNMPNAHQRNLRPHPSASDGCCRPMVSRWRPNGLTNCRLASVPGPDLPPGPGRVFRAWAFGRISGDRDVDGLGPGPVPGSRANVLTGRGTLPNPGQSRIADRPLAR